METFNPEDFTKYEKARMIGSRALQIAMGAPFLIKLTEKDIVELKYNPISIAKMEFKKGVIPLTIVRPLPKAIVDSGSVEEVSTLGKKLVKEIQQTEEDEKSLEDDMKQSMEEIMKEMSSQDDD